MEALGINLTWFLFQLVNFAVLCVGLTYLLHKPLLKILDNRKKEVSESLALAEQMRQEATASEKRQQTLLQKAQADASHLLSEAKNQSKEVETRMTNQAEQKVQEMMEKATAEITQERRQMKEELKSELIDVVVTASEKIIGVMPENLKKEQLGKLMQELK